MNSPPGRWTQQERWQAIKAFFASGEGQRFLDVFSRAEIKAEDREVFLRDAERRACCEDQAASHWWRSLQALVKSEQRQLALAEPLAQNGIAIDELYECLLDDFDPLALRRAIDLAVGIKNGRRGVLPPLGFTNTAGWSVQKIRSRLEEVKEHLDWRNVNANARQWWEVFEAGDESEQRMELVLLLAEELAHRRVTINDFHAVHTLANTENIRAALHYLDYTRLKAETAQLPANQSGLTSGDTAWWLKPAPRMTRVRGWTDEQIRSRLEDVKAQLGWENAAAEICQWWEAFENENQHRLALVLRLAEELANRNVTITEFHRAFGLAQTSDIQANLFYLDYLRLTMGTFDYETVVLDETGKVTERRRGEARRFVEELVPGVTLEMVEIPGGTFLMGSPDSEEGRSDDEGPVRKVTVSPFQMGKFAVTQEQWNVVASWEKVERDLSPDPSRFKGIDLPVETVSWKEATEFCARLSRKTGRIYRLPTEAEWEYACRARTTTPFAFGETITPEIVNYNGNHPYGKAAKGIYRNTTVRVGSLGVANAFGLFDMHGNVWEWCQDVWHDNYNKAPVDGSAWLSGGNSSSRVLRGGSWGNDGFFCRSATSDINVPGFRDGNDGFRVVVSARTSDT